MQKLGPRPPSLVLSNTAILCLLLSHLAQAASREGGDSSSGVNWVSPGPTDVYTPGDKMVASWSAPYGTTSPSFQLCLSDTQECGQAVWPNVKKLANGTYTITMTIPQLGGDSTFFVRMEDDDGDISDTPVFKLQVSPDRSSQSTGPGSPSDSPSSSSPSSSSGSSSSDPNFSSSGQSGSGSPLGSSEKNDPGNQGTNSKTSSGARASGTLTAISSALNNTAFSAPTGSTSLSLLPSATNKALVATAGDNKPSTVAIVIPLAIFAAALAGLIFSLRQRSKARKEAERGSGAPQEDSSLHRAVSKESAVTVSDSSSSRSQTDLERAMDFISAVQVSRSPALAPITPNTESKQHTGTQKESEGGAIPEANQVAHASHMPPQLAGRFANGEPPPLNFAPMAVGSQTLDARAFQTAGPPVETQHPGPFVVYPGFPYGPSMYQLPTIPRAVPLIEPSTYAALIPGNGLHSESQQTLAAVPSGLEPMRSLLGMEVPRPPTVLHSQFPGHSQYPTEQWRQPPGLTGTPAIQGAQTHLNLSVVQPVESAPPASALTPVQMTMPSPPYVPPGTEPLPPPPALPASLRVAQPRAPSPLEHQLYHEVAQPQPHSTVGPSIPHATRPSTSSSTISSTLNGLPNPYAAIEMALRAGS